MLRFVLPELILAVPAAAVLIDRLIVRFPRSVLVVLTVALSTTATVATFKPAHAFLARVKNGVWDRATFYRLPSLVDELEPGTRILNLADSSWNYPLLGRRLSNVVIDEHVWAPLARRESPPSGNPPVSHKLQSAGLPVSIRALRDNAIDYIFVTEPWATDWPDDLPLELVYDDSEKQAREHLPASRLYRVRPVIEGNVKKSR